MVLAVPIAVVLLLGGLLAGVAWRERAEQADWYDRGAAAAEVGNVLAAADAFAAAGGYRDAGDRRAEMLTRLDPYQTMYLEGVLALDDDQYGAALTALVPLAQELPTYRDVGELLATAWQAREAELWDQVAAAETRREWLVAERALAELVAANPNDHRAGERLETMRRTHAPLLFGRDDGLYLVGPDLRDERLVTDAVPAVWPVWSPDRSRIAFVTVDVATHDGSRLSIINADGTGLKHLVTGISPYRPPAWSPDGTKLAYTSHADFDFISSRGTISVGVVDIASGAITDVTGAALAHANAAVWSPAGDQLAFVSRRLVPVDPAGQIMAFREAEVYVATLATRRLEIVSQGRLPDAWRLAWSPVDEQLLVLSLHDNGGFELNQTSIQLLNLTSGAISQVNDARGDYGMPVWAPDGQRLAFVSGGKTVQIHTRWARIYTIWLETPVTEHLSWAPDGAALIVAANGTVDQSSYLIPVDGVDALRPLPLRLAFRTDRYLGAPPQWTSTYVSAADSPFVTGSGLLGRDVAPGGIVSDGG